MAKVHDEGERVHAEDARAWAAWLEQNHERESGTWLIYPRKHAATGDLDYDSAVTEALRFGWIDSRGSALDEDRTMLWFTPRRRGSGWSPTNKERIERLEREGRMAPAGARLVAAAKADGSWSQGRRGEGARRSC